MLEGFDREEYSDKKLVLQSEPQPKRHGRRGKKRKADCERESAPDEPVSVWVNPLVLCSQSAVFKALLHTSSMSECSQKEVTVHVDESQRDAFLLMLRCAYAMNSRPFEGEGVSLLRVVEVLEVCDKFGFSHVMRRAFSWLADHAKGHQEEFCDENIRQLRLLPEHVKVLREFRLLWRALCERLVASGDLTAWQHGPFPLKSHQEVEELLVRYDLIVRSEDEVLHAVMAFAEQQELGKEDTKSLLRSCVAATPFS